MSSDLKINEKWSTILDDWNSVDDRSLATEAAYSQSIPDDIRSDAWFIMSGARDLMYKNQGVYLSLTNSGKPTVVESIQKDLCRTFKSKEDDDRFGDGLLRILTAYSSFNVAIGYSQGMNYIAGTLNESRSLFLSFKMYMI